MRGVDYRGIIGEVIILDQQATSTYVLFFSRVEEVLSICFNIVGRIVLSSVPNVDSITGKVGLVIRKTIISNQNNWLFLSVIEQACLRFNGVIHEYRRIDADCATKYAYIANEIILCEENWPFGFGNVNSRMLLQL